MCSPLPLAGEGLGERGSARSFRQFQSSFVRLPAPELLFSCVAKRKVTQREGHPGWRFPSIHGRKVRESAPGFSSGHPARAKRRCPPWQRPPRGLLVPASPPPRGPGKAARILRALFEEPNQQRGALPPPPNLQEPLVRHPLSSHFQPVLVMPSSVECCTARVT